MDATEQLKSLIASYQNVLKLCYEALDAGAPQEQRDAVRQSIESLITENAD
jgi:hypothetical protein